MQFSSNYIAYNTAFLAKSSSSIVFIFSDVSSNMSQSDSIFYNLLAVSISQHYLLYYRAINDHLSLTTPFDNFTFFLFLKFSLHQLVSFFLFFFFWVIPSLTHSCSSSMFSFSIPTYALYFIATFAILTFTHISSYYAQLYHCCH